MKMNMKAGLMRDFLATRADAARLRAQTVYQHLRRNGRNTTLREIRAEVDAAISGWECEECAVRWAGDVGTCWICSRPGVYRGRLLLAV